MRNVQLLIMLFIIFHMFQKYSFDFNTISTIYIHIKRMYIYFSSASSSSNFTLLIALVFIFFFDSCVYLKIKSLHINAKLLSVCLLLLLPVVSATKRFGNGVNYEMKLKTMTTTTAMMMMMISKMPRQQGEKYPCLAYNIPYHTYMSNKRRNRIYKCNK